MERSPCLVPPSYDIDSLLSQDFMTPPANGERAAYNVVEKIVEALEKLPNGVYGYRPESSLLLPELVALDLWYFQLSMGSGIESSLGYGGGFACFFRALRALRILKHRQALQLAEAFRDAVVASGISEPARFPDAHMHGDFEVDWESELDKAPDFWEAIEPAGKIFNKGWSALTYDYWASNKLADPENLELNIAICVYLKAQQELLRQRKS